jgi:hypothetical protein
LCLFYRGQFFLLLSFPDICHGFWLNDALVHLLSDHFLQVCTVRAFWIFTLTKRLAEFPDWTIVIQICFSGEGKVESPSHTNTAMEAEE